MNSHDDWARWGESWQQQPAVDVNRLRRLMQRKLWRMRVVVTLEISITLVTTAQLLWLLWQPEYSVRWKIWAGASLVFMASLQAMFLHIRRGTWSASADGVRELLQMGARRARAGIRLAKLNAWSTALLIVATLAAAWPELDPGRWQHDPKLRLILGVQFAANVPIVIAVFAFCVWYVRRQRRRLGHFEAQLRDLSDSDAEPGAR